MYHYSDTPIHLLNTLYAFGYDTVYAVLDRRYAPDTEYCVPHANWLKSDGAIDCNQYWLRNLSVKVSPRGLFVGGSVPKFLWNQNLSSASPEDVRKYFAIVSDILHVPMEHALVYKIDGAATFVGLSQPMPVYLPLFQHAQGFERWDQGGHGVMFKRPNEQMSFYDKRYYERRRKLPVELRTQNIGRFELRYTGRVQKRFEDFGGALTTATLSNEDFFEYFEGLWVDSYDSVTKNHDKPSITNVHSQAEHHTYVYNYGIQAMGGPHAAINDVESVRHNLRDRQHLQRIRNVIIDRHEQGASLTTTNELIAEFDTFIQRAREAAR